MATHKYTNGDSSPRFRAGGYVRVSTEEQLDDYSIFGGNSQNRPAFNEMMEGARAGEFDVLIVDRMDRFGRDSSHLIETLKKLQDLGAELMSVREETGTDSCPDNTAHP